MHPTSHFRVTVEETFVIIVPAMFVIMLASFRLNSFIALLNCAYQAAYEDVACHARLNHAEINCHNNGAGV